MGNLGPSLFPASQQEESGSRRGSVAETVAAWFSYLPTAVAQEPKVTRSQMQGWDVGRLLICCGWPVSWTNPPARPCSSLVVVPCPGLPGRPLWSLPWSIQPTRGPGRDGPPVASVSRLHPLESTLFSASRLTFFFSFAKRTLSVPARRPSPGMPSNRSQSGF